MPPNGVIAPNIFISVTANIYKLTENNNIPTINKYPDILKLISGNSLNKIPFIINPIE